MLITATLRKTSHIHKMWEVSPHKIAGIISGVRFEKTTGGVFVANNLTPDEASSLQGHPNVDVAVIAEAAIAKPPVSEPTPPPVVPSEPIQEPSDAALEPLPAPPPVVSLPDRTVSTPSPKSPPVKRGPGRPRKH